MLPDKEFGMKLLVAILMILFLGGCSNIGSTSGMFWSDSVYQSDPHLSDLWWTSKQEQMKNGGTWW